MVKAKAWWFFALGVVLCIVAMNIAGEANSESDRGDRVVCLILGIGGASFVVAWAILLPGWAVADSIQKRDQSPSS